jgi:hypothetical protein
MGQVADEQFVDEVDGPEDIVDQQQDPTVVIMPADHERIEAQNAVDNACVPVVHVGRLIGEGNLS